MGRDVEPERSRAPKRSQSWGHRRCVAADQQLAQERDDLILSAQPCFHERLLAGHFGLRSSLCLRKVLDLLQGPGISRLLALHVHGDPGVHKGFHQV